MILSRVLAWLREEPNKGDFTKGKIKYGKDAITLGSDERSATPADKLRTVRFLLAKSPTTGLNVLKMGCRVSGARWHRLERRRVERSRQERPAQRATVTRGSWPSNRSPPICGVDGSKVPVGAYFYASKLPSVAFRGSGGVGWIVRHCLLWIHLRHGEPSWFDFPARNFPKWAEPEVFGL